MLGLFGNSSSIPKSWIPLTSMDEFHQALELSKSAPIAFFKHSTSCSRSAFAKHRLEQAFKTAQKVKLYYVDLLAHRNISDAISKTLKLTHQSPQLIVVVDQKVIYHASHEGIEWNKALTKIVV